MYLQDEISSTSGLSYVAHPINALHLLKRMSGEIFKRLRAASLGGELGALLREEFSGWSPPEESDFSSGATFGVLNLQVFHKLDVREVSRGNITS